MLKKNLDDFFLKAFLDELQSVIYNNNRVDWG